MFLASSCAYASLVQAATHLIDGAAILPDPRKHLLHHTGFLKEEIKACFPAPFLFVDITVAEGCMAQDPNAPLLGCMAFAASAPFQKFGSFIFGNDAPLLAGATDLPVFARGAD